MKLLVAFLANITPGFGDQVESRLCPSKYETDFINNPSLGTFPWTNGCYTQNQVWSPNTPIECEMTNPNCLVVECTGTSMKAKMYGQLFHTHGTPMANDIGPSDFLNQLKSGTRKLEYNGNVLEYGKDCGFKFEKNTVDGKPHGPERYITIDWSFLDCPFNKPTINGNDLVYNVLLSSPGNAPGIADIEFYVDTSVNIECRYDRNITIDAEGFWVNQEDVLLAENKTGILEGVAECKFFADEKRENQIKSDSIVNMGTTLYGMVDSHLKMPGLQYTLTDVIVSNGNTDNNTGKSYSVIDAGKLSSEVEAQSTGSAMTGSDVFFSYLAFGFENLEHQNQLKIVCKVSVEPAPTEPPQSMLFFSGISDPLLISDTGVIDNDLEGHNINQYDLTGSCGVTYENKRYIFGPTYFSPSNNYPVLQLDGCKLKAVAQLSYHFFHGACDANNDGVVLCFAVGNKEARKCRQWTINGISAEFPPSAYYHDETSIALSPDGFLAVGGFNVKAEMFNFATNEWTEVADYPTDIVGIFAYDMVYLANIDAYVVIGGRDDAARRRRSDSGPDDGAINMFQNGAWSNVGKLNRPRGNHVAQMINGMMIVAGGNGVYPTEKCIWDNETNQFVCTDMEPTLSNKEDGISFVVDEDYCGAP